MSVKVMSQVIQFYPGAGGEYTLAICLADFANNLGDSIYPSVATLAANSRQSERTVQRQLKAMVDSGWLRIVEGGGGAGRATRYRISEKWILDPSEWAGGAHGKRQPGAGHNKDYLVTPGEKKSGKANIENGDTSVTVSFPQTVTPETKNGDTAVTLLSPKTVTSETKKGDTAMSPEQVQNLKTLPPLSPHIESGGTEAIEDRRLGAWMLDRIRQMHPKHRDPPWKRWCRDIRIMRERDKRTRREIAELFAWANADGFWQANILSPGKLREKWDQLEIRRGAPAPGQAKPVATDRNCATVTDGGRCGRPGIRSDGNHANAPWYCGQHWDEIERQRAECLT